jgi:hypothetical protein
MTRLFPHRDGRRGEIWVSEAPDGNGDVSRKTFTLPVDRGAARGTEMKGQGVAAFCCPHPRVSLPANVTCSRRKRAWLLTTAASAALALQAVAHGDARWFALNRKVKLPAAAGRVLGHGSTPWLLI